ncbi:MAG: RagB/SusD family nutrient uptake outer membrane protein [Chitinophagaceae bacterium]
MNKIIHFTAILAVVVFSSCEKFIDVLPKGTKIPTTFSDYEALLRDEYTSHTANVAQALNLRNDVFQTSANLNYDKLTAANYFWDEDADRIALNNSGEITYYRGYAAISNANLIINYALGATDATSDQIQELIAQAKVLRAFNYNQLVNYYADTYESANAATKLSVPLILSPDIGAPYTQVTIAALYDFMLKDIEEAIPNLKATSATILHPNLGAAYPLRARIYLEMQNYSEALAASNEALKYNDQLYDWTAYYATYKAKIEQAGIYNINPTPMGFDYIENYYFRHGSSAYTGRESSLRVDRASRFENGDARFASRWKLRTVGNDSYFYSITSGFFNVGGLTTTEVYLIKAECQARANNVSGALTTLDLVRKKRIFTNDFNPSVATTVVEAVKLIQRTKQNETILGIVPFADTRRLNKDADYKVTFTKTENGQQKSLAPDSHLWTMPFPLGAIKNPGNGSLKQNVTK